ncbi:MAG: hypothetical protein LM578_03060 [Desulfurococcaceae archaeon]|nr:hypothetical protein [Desulfurococcaceae archaeon]
MGSEGKVKLLIAMAWEFYERGSKELEEGLREGDEIKVRDGAEKLWNAIINATNALVLSKLNIIPASHWERRKALERLEDADPSIEALGLRDRYGARERYLHEMTFYDGIVDAEMLKREVVKVKKYIEDVEKLIWREGG